MSFTISPGSVDVRLGGTTKFTYVDSTPPPAPTTPPTPPPPKPVWRVQAGNPGRIDADGTFHAPAAPPAALPATPTATVELTVGGTVVASAAIRFVIPWPADWPYLDDGGDRPWDPAMREWMARVLFDLLSHLPADTVKMMGAPPIVRVVRNPPGDAYYNQYHLFAGRVEIVDHAVAPRFGGGAPTGQAYDYMGDILMHELAHSIMMQLCGGNVAYYQRLLGTIGDLIQALALQVVAIGTALFALPLLPVEMGMGSALAGGSALASRDAMSDYGDASDWATHNWAAAKIPLLGLILPWVTTAAPNYLTALRGPWFGLRNKTLGPESTWEKLNALPGTDPKRAAAMTLAGAPTLYSLSAAQEDFAETLMAMVAGPVNLLPNHGTAQMPSAKRIDYLRTKKILPASFPTPAAGTAKTYDINNFRAWTIDPTRPKPARAPEAAATTAAAKPDVRPTLRLMFEEWARGPAVHLERNREILAALFPEGANPSLVDFAHVAELHGTGLRRYRGVEHACAEGDLLIARDAQLWMVTKVDAEGRVIHATGRLLAPGTKRVEDLQVPRDTLVYHWAPSAARRTFAAGATAPSGYPDIEAAMHALVGLWGAQQVEKTDVRNVAGFLRVFLSTAGLTSDPALVADVDEHREAIGYLQTHGAGLEPYLPARDRLLVGDLLVPFHGNTLAIVTRVDGSGRVVDALHGGTWQPGLIGEAAGAIKLEHDVDPLDFHFVWRPSSQPRRWNAPEGA